MAADQLLADLPANVGHLEMAQLTGELRLKYHLEKKVTQLFAERIP
jgi:hypothetical protein